MKTLLKNKEAVHCETEQEAQQVLKALHEDGYRWWDGASLTISSNNWNVYTENTCYSNRVGYAPYSFYSEEGYEILSATDFLLRVGLPERWKVERTADNHQILNDWANKVSSGQDHQGYSVGRGYIHSHNIDTSSSPRSGNDPAYTEITFEQFKQHILNKMKTYKLKKTYPGSPELGAISCEDMSGYPEYWEEINEPFPRGAYLKVLQKGGRYTTHPQIAKILNVEDRDKVYYAAPDTDYIKFVQMTSFYNCPEVLIGKHEGKFYAYVYCASHFKEVSLYEYQQYSKVEIAGYNMERVGSNYKFGCQTFTAEELNVIRRIVNHTTVTIGGTEITKELLNKIK